MGDGKNTGQTLVTISVPCMDRFEIYKGKHYLISPGQSVFRRKNKRKSGNEEQWNSSPDFKHHSHWVSGWRWRIQMRKRWRWLGFKPNNWKMEIKTYPESWYVRCGAGWEKGPVHSRAWEWCSPHEMRSGTHLGWDFGFRLGHIWWYLGLWKPASLGTSSRPRWRFNMEIFMHMSMGKK